VALLKRRKLLILRVARYAKTIKRNATRWVLCVVKHWRCHVFVQGSGGIVATTGDHSSPGKFEAVLNQEMSHGDVLLAELLIVLVFIDDQLHLSCVSRSNRASDNRNGVRFRRSVVLVCVNGQVSCSACGSRRDALR